MDHTYGSEDSDDLKIYPCSLCKKKYRYKYSLTRHMCKEHKQSQPARRHRVKCPDPECALVFGFRYKLREHIENDHGVPIEYVVKQFKSFDDFEVWKEGVEKETRSSYCRELTGKRIGNRSTLVYFICNKSGFQGKPRSTGKKNVSSKKIDGMCPSAMNLRVSKKGHIEVRYWATHFGHSCEVDCTTLSYGDKVDIANKLKEGTSFEKILDDVQDSILDNDIQRIHLLSRKDLHNICASFNIEREVVQENEADSVHAWVDSMEAFEDNPVIYYKEKGHEDWKLRKSDYVLILMSEMQQSMLEDQSVNILCIDFIQNMCGQNFNLITLMTIDDYEIGVPLASCLSNRIDGTIISFFFNVIKSKVGVISAKVFMSADLSLFYSMWEGIMEPVNCQLLCSWDVEKMWRKNLEKVQCPRLKKIRIYRTMKLLMSEQHYEKFHIMLNDTLRELDSDDDWKAFAEYFRTRYLERAQLWAFCHRSQFISHLNKHLEQVHRIMYECYVEGRSERHLNTYGRSLSLLVEFSKSRILEKTEKMEKGPQIHKIYTDQQMQADIQNIEVIKTDVPVADDDCYVVEHKKDEKCPSECKPICADCGICFHKFVCNCSENAINSSICNHIFASINMLKSQCTHFDKKTENSNSNINAAERFGLTKRSKYKRRSKKNLEKSDKPKRKYIRKVIADEQIKKSVDSTKEELIRDTEIEQIEISNNDSDSNRATNETIEDRWSAVSSDEEESQSLLLKKFEHLHHLVKCKTVDPEEYEMINNHLDEIMTCLNAD